MESTQTITIYKAPQPGKGQKILDIGFQPDDFEYNPPFADGKCYFAAPDSRSLAEDYNKYYKDGIMEVKIDKDIYEEYFQPLERPYQGSSQIELAVPQSLFPILNKFPRILKQQ